VKTLKRIVSFALVVLMLFGILNPAQVTYAGLVRTQVCIVIDGSGSISGTEWTTIKNGIATAINTTVPRDGTVELTIVQFGYSQSSGYAKTEIPPTVVDGGNYTTVINQVLAMPKGGQSTPMAHGIFLGWKELRNSPNFAFSRKQVINLATDGVPNIRNNNATSDLDASGTTNAYDDVIAATDYAVTQGLDELDMEGIGTEANSSKDWFQTWAVRPRPGIIAPPFTKPGWVRLVANATEFANTVNQKFELILGNAKTQLCMVIDGSGSISGTEWTTTKNGVADAIRNQVPHDGSVELSIVQFGYSTANGYAKVEISPTIVTSANYETIASNVTAIVHGAGSTPMAHGLYLGWITLKSSINFASSTRQIINLATDGDPNIRNSNATSDLDGSTGSPNAKDDVIAVANYAMSQGLDELDAEGIGITNSSRDWLRSYVVRPQPGNLAPPFTAGWIRVVANSSVFAQTVGEKFTVVLSDLNPPNITDMYQQPASGNVTPADSVNVFANVTDDLSGVKQVVLNYTVDGSAPISILMSNLDGNTYNATIPAFSLGTHITYVIIAEDFANNSITTQTMGYDYNYDVIPEIPTSTLVLLIITLTILIALIRRKKVASRARLQRLDGQT
jgi:Mg-chelatase subunit ChlD